MLKTRQDLLFACIGAALEEIVAGLVLFFYVGNRLEVGVKVFLVALSAVGLGLFLFSNRPRAAS